MKFAGAQYQSFAKAVAVFIAATVVTAGVFVVGGSSRGATAASPAAKHTICHRTHSTTNPYRRITVSANAIFLGNKDAFKASGHSNASHNQVRTGFSPALDNDGNTINNYFDPEVTYAPNEKKWGDIIPPYIADGAFGNSDETQNYGDFDDGDMTEEVGEDFTGKKIFDGAVGYEGLCGEMTALEFLEAECGDAAPEDETTCLDTALDDLTDQGAAEDAGLKASLGVGGFDNLKGQTLTAITNDVEGAAPSARTHDGLDAGGPCTVVDGDGGTEVVLHGSAFTNDRLLFVFFQHGSSAPLPDPESADLSAWDLQLIDSPTSADMQTIAETGVTQFDSGVSPTALAVDSAALTTATDVFFRLIVVTEVEDPDTAGAYLSSWYYGETETCSLSPEDWTLTVDRDGAGEGSVSDGADLSCSDGTGACDSGPFADGSSVTLTADPAPGSEFAGWSGDAGADVCDDTELTCDLTIGADSDVTATFDVTPPSGGGGGGGGGRGTTLPPDPGSVAPPTTNPETDGEDDLTGDLEPQLTPDPTDPSGGGSLEIPQDPNDPLQVTECLVDDPDYICEIQFSGPDYNKPEVWEEQGYGDECWKFEPGDYSYILPSPPVPPSGRSGGVYSTVIVKAGSLTSTDPNFRVNTVFRNPSPGSRVWPDNNMNGVFDPGGRYGDKLISHVIVCVDYPGSPTPTTVAPTTVAPTTAVPTTVAPTTAVPTTVAPTTVAPTTVAPTTVAPTTVAPTTAVPTTAVPTTTPPSVQPLRLRITPRPGSNPTPGPTRVSIRVTNGIDQETYSPTIDLRNFRLVSNRPSLPSTGRDSGAPLTIALWVLVGGLFLAGTRRHLLARR